MKKKNPCIHNLDILFNNLSCRKREQTKKTSLCQLASHIFTVVVLPDCSRVINYFLYLPDWFVFEFMIWFQDGSRNTFFSIISTPVNFRKVFCICTYTRTYVCVILFCEDCGRIKMVCLWKQRAVTHFVNSFPSYVFEHILQASNNQFLIHSVLCCVLMTSFLIGS